MTKMFMDMDHHILKTYETTNCLNATNIPCWVPQMKDIVEYETQKNLEKCISLMDYNCEKMVLWHSMIGIGLNKCPRPCDKLHYKPIKGEVYQIPSEDSELVSVITFLKWDMLIMELQFTVQHRAIIGFWNPDSAPTQRKKGTIDEIF